MPPRPPRSRPGTGHTSAGGAEAARAVRALNAWKKSLDSYVGFLEQLADVSALGGEVWKAKMRAHYGSLANALLDTPPLGGDRLVGAYRRRIATLTATK